MAELESGNATTVRLGTTLDINSAASLHGEIRAALTSAAPLQLDASAVERIDTAALQVFAALFNDTHAAHDRVVWQTPTQTLIDTARLLGLTEHLRLTGRMDTAL